MRVSNAECMGVDSSEGFYVHTCIGAHFLAAIAPVHVTGSCRGLTGPCKLLATVDMVMAVSIYCELLPFCIAGHI